MNLFWGIYKDVIIERADSYVDSFLLTVRCSVSFVKNVPVPVDINYAKLCLSGTVLHVTLKRLSLFWHCGSHCEVNDVRL